MKEKYKLVRKQFISKTLYKMVITNIVLVLIIVLFMLPIYLQEEKVLEGKVMQYAESSLTKQLSQLTDELDQIDLLGHQLKHKRDIAILSKYDKHNLNHTYKNQKNIQENICDTYLPLNLISNIYMVFMNHEMIVSGKNVIENTNLIYPDEFCKSIEDYKVLKQSIFTEPDKNTFYIGKNGNLIYVAKNSNNYIRDGFATIAIIEKENISKFFMGDGTLFDGDMVLKDGDGQIIASKNFLESESLCDNNYNIITLEDETLKLNLEVGIPQQYITEQMKPISDMIGKYIIIVVFMGCFVSILMAYFEYRPLFNLVKEVGIERIDDNKKNEFEFIKEQFMTSRFESQNLEKQISEMKALLEISIVDKLLNNQSLDEELDATWKEIQFKLPEDFVVICITTTAKDEEKDYFRFNKIFEVLNHKFYFHISGKGNLIYIVECHDDLELDSLSEYLRDNINGEHYRIGMSRRHNKLSEVGTAYDEAALSLKHCIETIPVRSFNTRVVEQQILDSREIKQLKEDVAKGAEGQIIELFNKVYHQIGMTELYSEGQFEDLYIKLKGVMTSIANERDVLSETLEVKNYCDYYIVHDMLLDFTKNFITLCKAVDLSKNSHNFLLREAICTYIDENYKNPNLYAKTIAEHFEISEKYLYSFVKEQIGRTLGEIVETKRLEYSLLLIKETDEKFSVIALSCGFNSVNTFYKAFKRIYGTTPGKIRKKEQLVNLGKQYQELVEKTIVIS